MYWVVMGSNEVGSYGVSGDGVMEWVVMARCGVGKIGSCGVGIMASCGVDDYVC